MDLPPLPTRVTPRSAAALLEHIRAFFLLCFHSLLHARALYPANTFLATRALNMVVYQSRHPGVCTWVKDVVASICTQLATGGVDKVVFAIIVPPAQDGDRTKGQSLRADFRVIERWVFDVASFPALPPGAWKATGSGFRPELEVVEAATSLNTEENSAKLQQQGDINWADLAEALRGGIRRLQIVAETAEPLPENCTFTVAVELKKEAVVTIAGPQPWIPATANMQPESQQVNRSSWQTKPVRAVNAGPFFFEVYVEEPANQRSRF